MDKFGLLTSTSKFHLYPLPSLTFYKDLGAVSRNALFSWRSFLAHYISHGVLRLLKLPKMSRHSPDRVEVPVITSSPPKSNSSPKGKDGHPPPAGYPLPPYDQPPPPPVVPVPVVAYVAEPVPPPPSCLDVCLATLCCCCLLDMCFPPYGPFF